MHGEIPLMSIFEIKTSCGRKHFHECFTHAEATRMSVQDGFEVAEVKEVSTNDICIDGFLLAFKRSTNVS